MHLVLIAHTLGEVNRLGVGVVAPAARSLHRVHHAIAAV